MRIERTCGHSPSSALESTRPARGGAPASEFFSDNLSQNVLVKRELGDQTLQARILVTQLPQLPDLGQAKLPVLLLPRIEARLAYSKLPTDLSHWSPALSLAQRVGDLLVRKSLALHGPRLR